MDIKAIKDEAVDWFTEQINTLHELAFGINEAKAQGVTFVPVEEYESLLNWSIEMMQGLRDDVDKHGDDMIPNPEKTRD